MLKFANKNKGSISIFLCIILLPMITYSMMVIDASRLQACRTQLQSAGDLSMNAALSEYEKILEDMYGLFAISDDPAVLEPALENYFYETISGVLNTNESDLDSDSRQYIQEWARELSKLIFTDGLDESDITSFMNMTLENFNYSPVEESRISNPMVMKGQIIDYMKYKGPVSVVSGLLTKIGLMKDTANQASAAEKKIEYTEEVQNLNDPMEIIWKELEGYESEGKKIIGYNFLVEDYNDKYDTSVKIHSIVKEAYNQARINVVNMCYWNHILAYEDKVNFRPNSSNPYDYLKVDDEVSKIDNVDHQSKVKTVDDAKDELSIIDGIIKEKFFDIDNIGTSEYEEKYGNINISFDKSEPEKIDEIEFGSINLSDDSFTPSMGNLIKWKNEITNSEVYQPENGKKKNVEQTKLYDTLKKYISNMDTIKDYKIYYEYFKRIRYDYDCIFEDYENEFSEKEREFYSRMKNALLAVDLAWGNSEQQECYKDFLRAINQGSPHLTDGKCDDPGKDYREYYKKVCAMCTRIENASSAAKDLLDKLEKVEQKAEEWSGEIDTVEDPAVKSQMQNDLAANSEPINRADVEAFKTVLDTIYSDLSLLKKDIESFTFLGYQMCVEEELDGSKWFYGGYTGNFLVKELDSDGITIKNEIKKLVDDGCKPHGTGKIVDDINASPYTVSAYVKEYEKIDGKNKDGSENEQEKFYYVLKNAYGRDAKGLDDESNKETNSQVDDINKIAVYSSDDTESSSTDNTDDDGDGPSYATGKADDVGTARKDINKNNKPATDNSTDDEEDEDNENEIEAGEAKQEKFSKDKKNASSGTTAGKNSLKNATSFLSKLGEIAEKIRDHVYLEEYFTEMFTCQTDKKKKDPVQLLNGYSNVPIQYLDFKPLNTDNPWYGKEIEYILWGDDNLNSNITKTDATIFLIRFALNTIYAFTASDIQSFANTVAVTVVGWIPVLVPVVQVCITLAISLAESAVDLAMLKDGEDVVIIKDTTTFVCSPAGALQNVAKKVAEKAIEKATEAANNFIEEKAECVEKTINEQIDKVADLGKKKISELADNVTNVVNSYSDSLVETIESSIKDYCITPLMSSISPIVSKLNDTASNAEELINEKIDSVWNTIGSSINGMNEGMIKDLVKDFFENRISDVKDSIKKELLEKIKKGIDNINVEELQKIITDKIHEKLVNFKESVIMAKVKEKTDEMKKKIMEHGDEAADNLKNYIHEGISDVSSTITGKISEVSQNAINKIGDTAVQTVSKPASGKLTLNYKEYCKLFVFISLIAGNEEKMLIRAAALIQCNVKYAAQNANPAFEMSKAYTLVYVGAEAKMPTLFPWGVEVSTDDSEGAGDASFSFSNMGNHSVTIRYSGINGF